MPKLYIQIRGFMTSILATPAIWLLILIVGLPQLSETIYTPSLPDIANSLAVPEAWVEYTLTIYLSGFAIGTLLWGKLSDKHGRKPYLLIGISIYILGCIGCYFSNSISDLLLSRFVQAFGGSTGSVLGQAICRDAFQGSKRGKVYSIIGSAIAFSPAIGPLTGGIIDQIFGWTSIFLLLILLGTILLFTVISKLPETLHTPHSKQAKLSTIMFKLIRDRRVLGFGIIVAACNGIPFSYYAEGPFYLIEMLDLTPSLYGASFLGTALAGMVGGFISHRLHNQLPSLIIMKRGIHLITFGTAIFVLLTMLFANSANQILLITITLVSMAITTVGIGMVIPNALSLALEEYTHSVGTASSLFGFFYYTLISLFTFIMGYLHNDSLYPMPVYFFIISLIIQVVYFFLIGKKHK